MVGDCHRRALVNFDTGVIGSAPPVNEVRGLRPETLNGNPSGARVSAPTLQSRTRTRTPEPRMLTWKEAAKDVDQKQRAFARFVQHAVRSKSYSQKPDCVVDLVKSTSDPDIIRRMEAFERENASKRQRSEAPTGEQGVDGERPRTGDGLANSGGSGRADGRDTASNTAGGHGKGRDLRKKGAKKSGATENVDEADGENGVERKRSERANLKDAVYALDYVAPKTAPSAYSEKVDKTLATPVSTRVRLCPLTRRPFFNHLRLPYYGWNCPKHGRMTTAKCEFEAWTSQSLYGPKYVTFIALCARARN